jgi:hypothetical protein
LFHCQKRRYIARAPGSDAASVIIFAEVVRRRERATAPMNKRKN